MSITDVYKWRDEVQRDYENKDDETPEEVNGPPNTSRVKKNNQQEQVIAQEVSDNCSMAYSADLQTQKQMSLSMKHAVHQITSNELSI